MWVSGQEGWNVVYHGWLCVCGGGDEVNGEISEETFLTLVHVLCKCINM